MSNASKSVAQRYDDYEKSSVLASHEQFRFQSIYKSQERLCGYFEGLFLEDAQ